jgi:peptide subunit release factor 1 (eRF1)
VFNESDLKDLLTFVSPAPVLSLYLKTDPVEGNADYFKQQVKSLLKNIDLPADIEEVERFFNHEYDWNGKGVAVFSSAPQQFFRAYSFALPLFNWIYVTDRPSVKPLADLIEDYGGYGVILIDKQHARLFHIHLGELQEQEGIEGTTVKHTKQGGTANIATLRGGTSRQTKYANDVVERNIKDSAELAVKFFEEHRVRRILICGQDSTVAALRKQLPKAWQSLVMGIFASRLSATQPEVLAQALEASRKAKEMREQKLIGEVLGKAATKTGAVLGLEPTLEAVNERRVRHLVVNSGFHKPAWLCVDCGLATLNPEQVCSNCDHRTQPIPDASDFAVSSVLRNGGEVTIVPSDETLAKAGSIGALLRY